MTRFRAFSSMPARKRPLFLDPLRIHLPVAGVLSIAHRISGVVLLLSLPFLLWLLESALSGETGFARASARLDGMGGWMIRFLLYWALLHHLFSGVRHLFIDADLGVEAPHYRWSAWGVVAGAPALALLMTGWPA